MCPLLPYLVRSSIGLNHCTSSTRTYTNIHVYTNMEKYATVNPPTSGHTHEMRRCRLNSTHMLLTSLWNTSVKEHVSNHGRFLVDFKRMSTQHYSLAYNSVRVYFIERPYGNQLMCIWKTRVEIPIGTQAKVERYCKVEIYNGHSWTQVRCLDFRCYNMLQHQVLR